MKPVSSFVLDNNLERNFNFCINEKSLKLVKTEKNVVNFYDIFQKKLIYKIELN